MKWFVQVSDRGLVRYWTLFSMLLSAFLILHRLEGAPFILYSL